MAIRVPEDTRQAAQLRDLSFAGADVPSLYDRDEDDEPEFGADPFDILMHKQEQETM